MTHISISQCIKLLYFFVSAKDIFLSFKESQQISAPFNDEHIVEQIKEFEPNIVYCLNIQFIPDWVQFLIVQAHVYLHNVTLKYNIEKVAHKYVTGQNIGLVQNVSSTGSTQIFLENENPYNVTVLLAVVLYNESGKYL